MIFYVSKGNNEVFFSFLAKKMVKFLHMSKKAVLLHSLSGNRKLHGGFSSVGRASDCGSECHGFEPHIPPTDILHGCLFFV